MVGPNIFNLIHFITNYKIDFFRNCKFETYQSRIGKIRHIIAYFDIANRYSGRIKGHSYFASYIEGCYIR